ncbi:hypothetical protein ACOMHN_038050 [Nucella lapillus]
MQNTAEDDLQPYKGHHGPVHRRLRDTQRCQHNRYGKTTYSLHAAHVNNSDVGRVVDVYHKMAEVGNFYYMKRNVDLRFQRVYNPERTLSVVEPGHRGSCEETKGVRVRVQDMASHNQCVFAANAGYFNTHTGKCLGNIVSDGRLVQDSGGIQNVHFGITKQGQIFTGYLSEIELVTLQFKQLVGGVVWLLRDGEIYVDESRNIECPDTEETGPLDRFISVVSARTAVGHDAQGHVLMVQLDGKTNKQGVNLRELAALLKDLGFVNAINLDGGGSTTSVVNGTVVNYPSDKCVNSSWNCARPVSTVLCVHSAQCAPDPRCSHRGQCQSGRCLCRLPWTGESCHVLACPHDCSGHGVCLEAGCACEGGWKGDDCSQRCGEGTHGVNCSRACLCLNNATCRPDSGACGCPPGFVGRHCEAKCKSGWYGENCGQSCLCPRQCFCHHVTGVCSNRTQDRDYLTVGQCLVTAAIEKDALVPDQTPLILQWRWIAIAASVVSIISVVISLMLAVALCKKKSPRRRRGRLRKRHLFKASGGDSMELMPLHAGDDSSGDDSTEESDEEVAVFEKRAHQSQSSSGRR